MQPLHIAAFMDTRPGHLKQTRGILEALKELTAISVTRASVAIPGLANQAGQWASWFLGRAAVPLECQSMASSTDLILGTGTHTHLPMLHYKRACKAPVVTCMTPSSLLVSRFDLCFVPAHDNSGPKPNLFETLGPPNTARDLKDHNPAQGLLLIGGTDPKNHVWDSETILETASAIIRHHKDIHWTVSSSFRTPPDMLPKLEQMQETLNNCVFFAARDTGPGWIEEQYNQADICWVTADSVSMTYEALSAGCRVGIIPVEWKNPSGKIAQGLKRLLSEKWVISFDDYFDNKQAWERRQALDEAGRAAREILRRWWPERLP
ncbi:MAG: mitochondrial fission ELM1 family protein [Desulfatibacillum sp.]|nr:mitochondrial fission ELM1 family protein [Desulfatibacillum sp.]